MFSCFPGSKKKNKVATIYPDNFDDVFEQSSWKISAELMQKNNQTVNMQKVAEQLGQHETTDFLHIFLGKSGFNGIEHIANAAAKHQGLKILIIEDDASYNSSHALTAGQAEAFAAMIAAQTNLIEVRLVGLSDATAHFIADALAKNNSLERLYILNNTMTEIGVKMIIDALKSNSKLEQMEIRFKHILSTAGIEEIRDIVTHQNAIIKKVHFATDAKAEIVSFDVSLQKQDTYVRRSTAGM